jgi:LCP family protein required for cell wall assembly
MITKTRKENNGLDRFREAKRKRWGWKILGLIVLGVILWYAATILFALNRVTTPNKTNSSSILNDVSKQESSQPINVLLIGIGGDSHPGGTLADSIMVASIDAKHNTISILSVPRDLYVNIPGYGKQKINAAHSFGELNKKQTGGGPALLEQVVADTLGVPIHYFVRVDFDGFKKIVDTLGGVTIDVKTPIYDPLFPDAKLKGYDPFSITAGIHKLDGKTALKYARSRETTSDFDRARRQQEIVKAIKDKTLTPEVLVNPKKVTDLISVVGTHLLTDFSANEVSDLLKIAKSLNDPTVNNQVLGVGDSSPLLTSGRSPIGASIIIPRAGMNDFSQIQLFSRTYFAAPGIASEKSTILLKRAGVTLDAETTLEKQLEQAGFTVTLADESTTPSTPGKTVFYDYSKKDHPISLDFLKSAYHLTNKNGDDTTETHDFVLVMGSDFSTVIKGNDVANKQTTKLTPTPKSAVTTSATPFIGD